MRKMNAKLEHGYCVPSMVTKGTGAIKWRKEGCGTHHHGPTFLLHHQQCHPRHAFGKVHKHIHSLTYSLYIYIYYYIPCYHGPRQQCPHAISVIPFFFFQKNVITQHSQCSQIRFGCGVSPPSPVLFFWLLIFKSLFSDPLFFSILLFLIVILVFLLHKVYIHFLSFFFFF